MYVDSFEYCIDNPDNPIIARATPGNFVAKLQLHCLLFKAY